MVYPFEGLPTNLIYQNYKHFENKAVKIIGSGKYINHATPFYSKLKILKISGLYKHEVAKLVFYHHHQRLPPLLLNFFTKTNQVPQMSTWLSSNQSFKSFKVSHKNYLWKTVCISTYYRNFNMQNKILVIAMWAEFVICFMTMICFFLLIYSSSTGNWGSQREFCGKNKRTWTNRYMPWCIDFNLAKSETEFEPRRKHH